jgi:hypothetical protein
MKNRKRATLVLAAAAAFAVSCSKIESITAPALTSGRVDFSVIAALGSGLTAGVQSGGLVDRHQTRSYASLFAQQVGARPLDLPLIDGAGIPPLLEIKRLVPLPVRIGPIAAPAGNPTNSLLPTAYHNLSVPGAFLRDLTDTTRYLNNPYFGLIQRTRGSIARQAAEQLNPQPTFLLLEYGTTEVMAPAAAGVATGLLSVAGFEDSLGHALDSLAALLPGAKIAIMNVPDVTNLPYFTTNSNKQLDRNGQPVLDANGRPRFLLGPNNVALTANDLVLLPARARLEQGVGYPQGTFSYLGDDSAAGQGVGLADAEVLSLSELLTIQDRAREFSFVIDTTAQNRDLAVVDLDGLYRKARTTGFEFRRVLYTSTFVTGGLFSLDGLHPNDLAQALVCNEVIRAVNAKFGSTIQPLRFGTLTSSRSGAARD